MKRITINQIYKKCNLINKIINIYGWIKNRRHSKSGISFIDIYDGSCSNIIQGIVKKNIINYNEVLKLTIGCSVNIIGVLILSHGKNQKYEIKINTIKVLGWIDSPNEYPISSKNNTLEFLRSIPHLRPRTNLIGSITRIRNNIFYSIHNFLQKKNYFWIPTPIITSLNSEGAGSMFHVSTLNKNQDNKDNNIHFIKKNFFGKKTFLTVSGQLTAEAYACAMTKVYTFGPTFRAENSNTTRHLSEFWMLEIEEAFSTLTDIIKLSNNIIKYIIKNILKNCNLELEFLYNKIDKNIFLRLENFLNSKITIIEYNDAIKILLKSKTYFKNSINFGIDLCSEHEKYLVNNYFNAPIFVINYPKNLKAFYMRLNNDHNTVAAMDFLVPNIGEIIGGSEREERKNFLKKRIVDLGLNKKDYLWYIDLRRYGSVPHSGFGLGFERLVSFITGIKNVKDVAPFPRTVNNVLC
ncbi:asparagine--tRNA ligase [Buchnera aphidicola]|uniref:Asparagine--tRNA ligase n=1 Tax=Buchnera aphidicola (Therioaphis trifolii) TaxID=1241884 RepID=A0A4D6YBC6_9GAMM|nr:asparagine--tRNA ligase [Buchnera aphidicola]QCI27237.1 asparagine--tRNA ligase [Buchnera aphidicola (Therioaphis trifolii)]